MLFSIITNIYSYRIEHAIKINTQNIILKNKISMTEGIICAVDIHQEAMKFVFIFIIYIICLIIYFWFYRLSRNFMSMVQIMMLSLIVNSVACLTLNIFQVSFRFHIIMYA